MTIGLFGNFGVQNLGDDLILKGFLGKFKDDHVIVFCGNPDGVSSKGGSTSGGKNKFLVDAYKFFPGGFRSILKYLFSPSYRREIKRGFNALFSVDKVYIGGGGILVDRHIKAVFLWWKQLWLILKSEKEFEFIANSFELKKWWSKRIFKKYLSRASKISVRDRQSKRFIESLGLKAELVEDLSVRYVSARGGSASGGRDVKNFYRSEGMGGRSRVGSPCKGPGVGGESDKIISLALCKWELGKNQKIALREFVKILQAEGYEVQALAFQTMGDDDREIYQELFPELKVLSGERDVLAALGNSSLLIAMRYHAVLLALGLDIPVIAIGYQDKIKNLMQDRGLEWQLISMDKLNRENLQEVFYSL